MTGPVVALAILCVVHAVAIWRLSRRVRGLEAAAKSAAEGLLAYAGDSAARQKACDETLLSARRLKASIEAQARAKGR